MLHCIVYHDDTFLMTQFLDKNYFSFNPLWISIFVEVSDVHSNIKGRSIQVFGSFYTLNTVFLEKKF